MSCLQRVKTVLLNTIGERPTARLQAWRFVRLIRANRNPDPEFQLLPELLNQGDVAVDVGANGANWTYQLHLAVGAKGHVLAFEADPYYALATELAIRRMRLGGVKVLPLGLSNIHERVPLRVTDDKGQRVSGLGCVDKGAPEDHKGIKMVHLKPLDSLLNEYPMLLRTALIKCDVEGYELFVFQGATDILAEARPFIVLEVGSYKNHGYAATDLYEFFSKRDYLPFALITDSLMCITDTDLDHEKALSENRLLVPTEKIRLIESLVA